MFFLQNTRRVNELVGPFHSSDEAWKWAQQGTRGVAWCLLSAILPKDVEPGQCGTKTVAEMMA